MPLGLNLLGVRAVMSGEDLDAACWVGAIERDAEGSHLQLQNKV